MASSSVRPSLDDIERISYGQAAKKRGVGSRVVPHRLNEAERKEWDLAKKRRFVSLRGTGWRKERGDSPLANIYRNYCDAVNMPCISMLRGVGPELYDCVIVDFSPLRLVDVSEPAGLCLEECKLYVETGTVTTVEDNTDISALGWDVSEIENQMKTDAIWRLPVYSIVTIFNNRADCKKYAERVAELVTKKK